MKSLCLKTNNSVILDYLSNELKDTKIHDICFSRNNFKNYKNIIIHYVGNDNKYFFESISSLLSFFILDEFEDTLIKRTIYKNYFYFDDSEKKQILEYCYDLFSEDYYKWFEKKFDSLHKDIYEFISKNKSIIIDGLINFKLQNYMLVLDEIVSESVSDYIVEKEYMEFISTLKLYVDSQDFNSDIIHLIYKNNKSILLDKNKNIIFASDELLNAKYLSDISFSANDYTLNSLLNLLPERIYVHLVDKSDEFITTLQLIFENRIYLCTDCNLYNFK